jgi:hypothetical protein
MVYLEEEIVVEGFRESPKWGSKEGYYIPIQIKVLVFRSIWPCEKTLSESWLHLGRECLV